MDDLRHPKRPARRKPRDGAGKPAPSSLPPEERYRKAFEAALRLLTNRERSAEEIRSRLRTRGYPDDTIEQVVERLRDTGLQDDPRFATRYAAEAAARGKAARLIQRELLGKGLEGELAAAAATVHPDEERARARTVAAKKARTLRGVPTQKAIQRIAGLLARRGFDPETCWTVARESIGEGIADPRGVEADVDGEACLDP